MDEFWIKNPSILIDKYWELIPTTKMSTIMKDLGIHEVIEYHTNDKGEKTKTTRFI